MGKRKEQVLQIYIEAYLHKNGRMPTAREIDEAIATPFKFQTKPLLPLQGATSSAAKLHQVLSGLLVDTRDIVELLRTYTYDLDALELSFLKEHEDIKLKAAEVMDYVQAVSDNESAVAVIYSGVPPQASCSTNIAQDQASITLKNSLKEFPPPLPTSSDAAWTVTAAPVSQSGSLTRETLSNPTGLKQHKTFTASVRSNSSTWVGTDLFFAFPVPGLDNIPPDILEMEEFDILKFMPTLQAIKVASTPATISISYIDPNTEQWVDLDTVTSNGNLNYFMNIQTQTVRLRFLVPGHDMNLKVSNVEFQSGSYNSSGTFYSLPLYLTPGANSTMGSPLVGHYLLDTKVYQPAGTSVQISYAKLTETQLTEHYATDIGGANLHLRDTSIVWQDLPNNVTTAKIHIGYEDELTDFSNTVNVRAGVATLAVPNNVSDITITGGDNYWQDQSTSTTDNAKYIYKSYLDVQGVARTVTIPVLAANYFIIKRITGEGASMYRATSENNIITLPPGLYKIIFSHLKSESTIVNAHRLVRRSSGVTLRGFAIPFTQVHDISSTNNTAVYQYAGGSVRFKIPTGLTTDQFDISYRNRKTDDAVPDAIVLKVKFSTTDPRTAPLLRRIRILNTERLHTEASESSTFSAPLVNDLPPRRD